LFLFSLFFFLSLWCWVFSSIDIITKITYSS
jgi:hypothetical protein